MYFITNILIHLHNVNSVVYEAYIQSPFTLLIKTKYCGYKGLEQKTTLLFTQWDEVHKAMIAVKIRRQFSGKFTNLPLNDVAI
ncbi:MAG: hypothetical protein CMH49_09660 [Myxococcales bacterium]|nr:hypothetical protein [Myxococcales bacterium]